MNNEIFEFKPNLNNSFQNDIIHNKSNIRKIDSKSLTIISSKIDMRYFKNDILKDVKKFEKNITDKFNKGDIIIKEEILNINNNINSINSKISELSTLISTDNMIQEKVVNLEKIKNKMYDKMLINEIKVNTIDKQTKEAIFNINNILRETVIYNGLIGPSCKYKTFHELVDFILNEIIMLSNYKDKNTLDLTSYKKKLDGIIQGFKFQIDNIIKSSSKFTLENFSICDKKIKDLSTNFNNKIEKIKNDLEEIYQNINNKLDDFEIRLNELKNDNISNINNYNLQMKEYLNIKEQVMKMNDLSNKKPLPFKRRNSLLSRLDSKDIDEMNKNINKNKIKKMKSSLKKETIDKLKNNELNNIDQLSSSNDNFQNNNYIDNQKKNYKKISSRNEINYKEGQEINNLSKEKLKSKTNSNLNVNINVDNLDISGKIHNYERTYENRNDKHNKESSKNYLTLFGKNHLYANNDNTLIDSEKEEKKIIKKKSPDIISNKTKNSSKIILKENILNNSSLGNSINSRLSLKINKSLSKEEEDKKPNNLLTERDIKRQNIKKKNYKNKFNQKIKTNEHNNIFISEFNKYKTLSSGNNNFNDKLSSLKNKLFPSRFKNVILTLEGPKRMIIDSKDSENGKNIYHIETSEPKKDYPKININERLTSSKPYIINKKFFRFQNDNLYFQKDDLANQVKLKNTKIIYLNKSESHKILMNNRINNYIENKNIKELEPSSNFTYYSPMNSKGFISLDYKNYQNKRNTKIKK